MITSSVFAWSFPLVFGMILPLPALQIGLGGSLKGTAETQIVFARCWYSVSHSVVGTYYEWISPLKWNKMKLLPFQVKN